MRYCELFEARHFSSTFQAWFKGSKVVDSHGQPLVVYHGTPHGFDEFDSNTIGTGNDQYGAGIYFAVSAEIAGGYTVSKNSDESPNTRPCFLAIKKPLIVDEHGFAGKDISPAVVRKLILAAPNYQDSLSNFGDVEWSGLANVMKDAVDAYDDQDYLRGLNMVGNDFYGSDTALFLRNCIKATPYDGVFVRKHDFYIAWSTDQVMSYFDKRVSH